MFSLIIPVYRNEETILPLIEALEGLAAQLSEPLETVFVVDGSPDRSFELLKEHLGNVSFESQLFLLARNFGSFLAIRLGLEKAHGPYFAVMAADLQEPIELMVKFREALASSEYDIVLGERVGRHDPWRTRLSARLFWWFYCRFVQPEMQPGGVDVFGCHQRVRDALLQMEESHTSLVGQLIWLGFRRTSIPYVRQRRIAGESSWTFRKKLNYLLNSVFSFTALPIALLGIVGALGVIGSLLLSAIVFFSWYANLIQVQGYTPLMLVILLSSSANLLGLSLVGSYVWRTYENSKRRPQSVVLRQISFPVPSRRE